MTINYSQLTEEQIDDFYAYFSKSISELFPEYTVLTREYFIEKDYTKEWMKGVISRKDKILFVARSGKDIAGYLLVNKVYGGVSVASWLAVFKDYQNMGVQPHLCKCGKLLLSTMTHTHYSYGPRTEIFPSMVKEVSLTQVLSKKDGLE